MFGWGEIMKKSFKLYGFYFYFNLNKRMCKWIISRIPSLKIEGITSRCLDGQHCLFIDYDFCNFDLVIEDYYKIQKKFNLPQGLIFTTDIDKDKDSFFGNFHVICLKKFSFQEINNILNCVHADPKFVEMPVRNRYKNWVLRQGIKGDRPRPEFLTTVGKPINQEFECSRPHYDFLKHYYAISDTNLKNLNFDKFQKFSKVKYTTWKH